MYLNARLRPMKTTLLLSALLLGASAAGAQAPVAFTSFQHPNTEKVVPMLDWLNEYEQLPEYEAWWTELAGCQNLPLPPKELLRGIRFFYVNAPDFLPTGTKAVHLEAGVTYGDQGQIFISVLHLKDKQLVGHEMAHYLLFLQGEPRWWDDNRPEFSRCGLKPTA
jgi:hypothetical protein